MPDQLLLYDTRVLQWVEDTFGAIIAPKTLSVMVGTPDRAFAEYFTPTPICPDGRPSLPRAALTIGDPEVDDERFNSNEITKLGYTDSSKLEIYRANYPIPVNIAYTLNFWTEWKREMNLFVQQILIDFGPQYKYLDVDIDTIAPIPIYGTKLVGMFKEGGVNETGDLEPGNQERLVRRSFSFHLKAWLWDFNFAKTYAIKEIVTEFYEDRDLTLLMTTSSIPQRQDLFEGDGSTTVFSGSVDPNILPIIEKTLLMDATIAGNNVRVRDDGGGNLIEPNSEIVSGTVDYPTGAIDVEYVTAPDDLTKVAIAYFTSLAID